MARPYRRRGRKLAWRWLALLLALPGAYLIAALVGSLIAVNRSWAETDRGVTVYLADNGIHADLIMPVAYQGLDWTRVLPPSDFPTVDRNASFVSFGSGERNVYLNTPSWWDITPRTIWSSLTGGKRVIHVEYVASPSYAVREIRLRPEEYRRLWSAVKSDFAPDRRGRPIRIDHPGYRRSDGFYEAQGRQNLFRTCNTAVAGWLRLAGVETSLWPPFVQGLTWRYRRQNWLAAF